jgi:crotonobetainyl-CoA:carnitine CoA-transferase CaiB-like acyl-CoA transferase
VKNVEEIDEIVGEWVARHDRDALVEILVKAEVAVGPVMDVADLAADPQLRHRKTLTRVADDELDEILMPEVQPKLTETPGRVRRAGPPLGRDTADILATTLGLDQKEIETLRAEKVI